MKFLSIFILHLALIGSIDLVAGNSDDSASAISSKDSKSEVASQESSEHKDDDGQTLDIINMSVSGVAAARGYDAQVHYALTKDGYYIHVLRLCNPYLKGHPPPKRPVVFNHGLIESSAIWLISSKGVRPENRAGMCETLPIDPEVAKNETEFLNGPMLLANHGYDVWLMSMRGTDVSMYHKTLDSSASAFWDYSLDNFALGDVPAVVNYVRKYTGHEKVAYVGHSQATFSVFGLLAAKPHYADIIEPVFAVAPVAYIYHTTSPVRQVVLAELNTPDLQGPMPEDSRRVRTKFYQYCSSEAKFPVRFICDATDSFLGGAGKSSLKGYLSFFPHHTSHKVLRHFGQLVKKKKFTMYDHGPEENMKRYGRSDAPLYEVERIRSKSIVLFWSKTDSLSEPRDVERFKSELRVPLYRDIFIDRVFNHFDMITHKDARYMVFAPMLEVLEEFEQRDGVCRPDSPVHTPIGNHIEQLKDNLFGAL